METIWRGTRRQLFERLALVPAALSGRVKEADDAVRNALTALGIEALSCLRDDFVSKARGGPGSDGVPWKPLSEAYIAYRRRHPGAAQDRLWRGVYASGMRRGEDSATAAARAWATVKAAGGKTIIAQYGKTPVEIGRDTGRLLASYSPGNPDNILEPQAGAVRVGSNVKYAQHFHRIRPIVPAELPQQWKVRLLDVLDAATPQLLRAMLGA